MKRKPVTTDGQASPRTDVFSKRGQRSSTSNRPKVDTFANISREGFLGQTVEDESESTAESSKYRVIEIEIDRVLDSPFQARENRAKWGEKQSRKFEQLRQSIREDGLNDIFFVAPHPEQEKAEDGYYILAYGGHNRRDAAGLEGYTSIPCIVVDYNHEKIGFGTTRENEVRIDLDAVERGRQYTLLMTEFHLTRDDLARRLDISPDVIKNCVMVFQCPEFIQEFIRELGEGGFRIARAFKKMWDRLREILEADTQKEAEIKSLFLPLMDGYKSSQMNVERIEAEIERILEQARQQKEEVSVVQSLSQNGNQPTDTMSHPDNTSVEKITATPSISDGELKLVSIVRALHRYQRLKGDDPPTAPECKLLDQIIQEAQQTRASALTQ